MGEKFMKEKLHFQEITIANLASIHFNSQKTKGPPFHGKDFCQFRLEDPLELPVRHTLISLYQDKCLNDWVIALLISEDASALDVENYKLDRKQVYKTRAWGSPDLFIICPDIVEHTAKARFLCCNDIKPGFYTVYDVDTGKAIKVSVSNTDKKLRQNAYVIWSYA